MSTNKPFMDLTSPKNIISCLEHYRQLLKNSRRLSKRSSPRQIKTVHSVIKNRPYKNLQPVKIPWLEPNLNQNTPFGKNEEFADNNSNQPRRKKPRPKSKPKASVKLNNAGKEATDHGGEKSRPIGDQNVGDDEKEITDQKPTEDEDCQISDHTRSHISTTTKVCARYCKKAQQALSHLNDEVSSVLRDTFCSIDDIGLRVRSTLDEITETTLQYQKLRIKAIQKSDDEKSNILQASQLGDGQFSKALMPSSSAPTLPAPSFSIRTLPKPTTPVPSFPEQSSPAPFLLAPSSPAPAFPTPPPSAPASSEPPFSAPPSPIPSLTTTSTSSTSLIKYEDCENIVPKPQIQQFITMAAPSEKPCKQENKALPKTEMKQNQQRTKSPTIKKKSNRKPFKKVMTSRELVEELTTRLGLEDVQKTKAHANLHDKLIKEFQQADSLLEFKKQLKSLNKSETKVKIKKEEKKNPNADKGTIEVIAEELFVPDRKINKIMPTASTNLKSTHAYHMLSKVNKQRKRRVRKCGAPITNPDPIQVKRKFSDSLYFTKSSKQLKIQNDAVVSVFTDAKVNDIPTIAHKTSSMVIKTQNFQTDIDQALPTPTLTCKAGLDCFDILDEITLNDIKPIAAEYPRKDHFGTDPDMMKVENGYLYKLVYCCPHKEFLNMVNIDGAKTQSRFPTVSRDDIKLPIRPHIFGPVIQLVQPEKPIFKPLPKSTIETRIVKNENGKHLATLKKMLKEEPRQVYSNFKKRNWPLTRPKGESVNSICATRPAFTFPQFSGTDSRYRNQRKTYKPQESHITEKLKPYANDITPKFSRYSVNANKLTRPKSAKAPPEIMAKLKNYMFDPARQYPTLITAMPVFVTTFQEPTKLAKHMEESKSKSASSETIRKPSPKISNSSSNVAQKLLPYIYDPCTEYRPEVTVLPLATNVDTMNFDISDLSTFKRNHGDFLKYESCSFNKPHKPNLINDRKQRISKSHKYPSNNLVSFVEKQHVQVDGSPFFHGLKIPTPPKSPKKLFNARTDSKSKFLSTLYSHTPTSPTLPSPSLKGIYERSKNNRLTYEEPIKEITKEVVQKSNILENNIQNVIEMIESKIIDIISSPEKTHSESFSTVEKEIIGILDTIRKAETQPLNTIVEKLDKDSQVEVEIAKLSSNTDEPTCKIVEISKSSLNNDEPVCTNVDIKSSNEECFQMTSSFSPKEYKSSFINENSTVEKLEKPALEIEAQNADKVPTKIPAPPSIKDKLKAKLLKNKKISKTDVKKIIEQKVDSINEIIDNINKHEMSSDAAVKEKIKQTLIAEEYGRTAYYKSEDSKKLKKYKHRQEDKKIKPPEKLQNKIGEDSPRAEGDGNKLQLTETHFNLIAQEGVHTVDEKVGEDSIKPSTPEKASLENEELIKPKENSDLKGEKVEEIENDQGELEKTSKEESSTAENKEPDQIEEEHLSTPFMKALVSYKSEKEEKHSTPNISEFLDTIKIIEEEDTNGDKMIRNIPKLYSKYRVSKAQVVHESEILYPIDIKNTTTLTCYRSLELPGESTRRSILSQLSYFLNWLLKLSSDYYPSDIEVTSIVHEDFKNDLIERKALMNYENDDLHGSFLNSIYSMIFVGMFFGLTLNYSCH